MHLIFLAFVKMWKSIHQCEKQWKCATLCALMRDTLLDYYFGEQLLWGFILKRPSSRCLVSITGQTSQPKGWSVTVDASLLLMVSNFRIFAKAQMLTTRLGSISLIDWLLHWICHQQCCYYRVFQQVWNHFGLVLS